MRSPQDLELDDETSDASHLMPQTAAPPPSGSRRNKVWAFRSSWAVNIFLLLAKIIAYAATGSKAVLASLADSAVDLASQVVISISEHLMQQKSDHYPVGRSRLEALGVIACASIMSMASVEVIQYSCTDLWAGFVRGEVLNIEAPPLMYVILGSGTAAKLALYYYCKQFKDSDSIAALAEDHYNDVLSNVAAIVTASIAAHIRKWWWVDPAGAIVISLVILFRWVVITWDQVKKVVGFTAPPEFVEEVRSLAVGHSRLLSVDCIRAYHFGARFNVELEIVLPRDMTVQESHDLSLELQHKIEAMEGDRVERAFVHVDYIQRELPEHKVERSLLVDDLRRRGPKSSGEALESIVAMSEIPRQHLVTAV